MRWLGEGGMGVVYEAEHIDMERRAAVKILRSQVCHHPAVVRAFRDEARAASRICSDFIVQLYDFAELPDQRLMIAMELLRGHTLHHALSRPMELSRAVGILRQVCQGLAAAHAAGVVHRDIKPENIFLTTRDGRADAVKLVDFGIAAIHDGTEATAIRSGTSFYLAPEVSVHGSVAASLDVYAWGCMAYEMLTGGVPFAGEDPSEVIRAHLVDIPPPPSSQCPEVPAAFDAVVMRCLDKDPTTRFSSMIEVEAALCEAQLAHGVRTAWDDLPLPMVEPERRERLVALLPEASLPVTRRRSTFMMVAGAALLVSSTAAIEALASRQPDATEELTPSARVGERGLEARAAAAKAFFVYPPVDEPSHATAYTLVKALEDQQGPGRVAALAVARELRTEFASTLVLLGDDYWNRDGGSTFATAYYEQALLFDPALEVARERSSLSDEQLEAFARRAETLAFSESELLGAEPLVVLAARDAESRSKKLEALQSRRRNRAAALDRKLAHLGGLSPAAFAVSRDSKDADAVALAVESETETEATAATEIAAATEASPEPAGVGDVPDEGAGPRLEGARPDPVRAQVLASKGHTALVAGHLERGEALFEQALGHDRRNVHALAGMRDVAFERGAYGRAVTFGERVVRVRPQGAEHRLRLGDAYLKVLRYRDALDQYERARALGATRAEWRIEKVSKLLGPR